MRALFVYQFLTIGGVETVLRARLAGLPEHGVEAHAWFLADYGGISVFEGQEQLVHVGSAAQLEEHLRTERYDVVSSIDTPAVFDLARRRDERFVVECHTPYVENQSYLRTLDLGLTEAVLVPTQHQADVVRAQLRQDVPVRIVPNPLHKAFTEPVRMTTPLAATGPVVTWIGRLDELKNWRGFVHLAAELAELAPTAQFWLVGKPVQPQVVSQLQALAAQKGVLGRLRWWNGLPHGRLPALIDHTRDSGGVVVSTSKGESFGMTIAEAMARGCAVVAPDRTPFTEFVRHAETGLLYVSGSTQAAAAAIAELLHDHECRGRLGRAGRERVLLGYSPETASAALARALLSTT